MSKAEKRYFKLQAALQKGNKSYLKLFDAIDALPVGLNADEYLLTYDETALRKKLNGKISLNQLHVTKNYLYGLILKSIRGLNEKANTDEQLSVLQAESRVLEQKGLYEQAAKKLKSAKSLALKYEKHKALIDIFTMETILCARHRTQEVGKELLELYEAVFKHLDLLEKEISYKSLLNKSTALYREGARIRDDYGKQKYQSIKNDKLLHANANPLTFLSKIYYYYANATLSQLAGNISIAIDYYRQLQNIWTGYPHFKKEYPSIYIIYSSNYLVSCHLIRDYSPFPALLADLKKVPNRNFDEEAEAFQNISFLEQLYFMNVGLFEAKKNVWTEAELLADHIEKGLSEYAPRIVKSRQMAFYHNTAIMFFALSDYDRSLLWAYKIQQSAKTDQRRDLQLFARLLQLIIFLEKGEHLYIDNAFKAFDYHLKKEDKHHDFEGKVTFFLKQVAARKKDKRTIFTKFQKELKEFEPHKIQGYEEISIWVESKLKNTSFLEILRKSSMQK